MTCAKRQCSIISIPIFLYVSAKVRSAWCPKIALGWPNLAYGSSGKHSRVCWSKQLRKINPTIWVLDLGFVGAWFWGILGPASGGIFWNRIPRQPGPETQRWFLVRSMQKDPSWSADLKDFIRLKNVPRSLKYWNFRFISPKGFGRKGLPSLKKQIDYKR